MKYLKAKLLIRQMKSQQALTELQLLQAWCAQENYTEANFLCPVINQVANLYTDALEIELAKEWSNRCVEYAVEQ